VDENLKKITFYLKLVLVSAVISATVLVMLYMANSTKNKLDELVNNQHNYVVMAVQGYIEHSEDEYSKFVSAFFDHNNILEFIESKDRENFYKNIVPYYNKYKSVDPFLRGIHIVLSDGMSFIKVHSPETPVDHIGKNRTLINRAIKTQKVQSGFEAGKSGYFYRVIYPIFKDDKFLGVSGFSYKIDKILDDLHEHYGFNIAFVFKKDSHSSRELTDYSKRSKDDYIIQYTAPKSLFKDISKASIDNKKNIFFKSNGNIFDIYSYDLKNNSKLVTFYDITSLINGRNATLYQLFAILITISFILVIFVIYIIDFFTKRIRKREAESLSKSEELYFKTRHNDLTELPNKNIMHEDMKTHEIYSVLMLNIDNISIFNTTYGANIVDIVLKEVAIYLQNNIPLNGILYHMSADEFTIILNEPSENQDILLSAQIKAYFEHTPICAENIKTHVNFSIGIASHKQNQDKNSKLNVYAKANIALVEAKYRGKGLILKFDESMSSYGSYTQLAKNIAILQRDLENENLIPFYQPIVDTYTKDIFKYEVLARIKGDSGFISPYEFLEAAEVAGLQTAITKQIIQKSFQYFSSTTTAFSINVTKHDLLENYLTNFLNAKSKRHNIDPKNVTLEILEDITIDNDDEIIAQINNLNSLGYVIAIDDFGVESSNISKLADLNADFIKIDGSFIKDIDHNEKHLRIVESLVYMANKLDMKIIAEYVHNESIYELIKSLGIQYSQGYYFSEPKKDI